MVTPRRRSSAPDDAEPQARPRGSEGNSLQGILDEYRRKLAIDKEDLDTGLVEQPELFWHVADALSVAQAERDALKLDIEIAEAQEGTKLRDEAAQTGEKLTEAGLREQLILVPRLQQLRRKRTDAERLIGGLTALKESFTQRGYSFRGLVPLYLSRHGGDAIRGEGDARTRRAEDINERAGREREERGFRRRDRG